MIFLCFAMTQCIFVRFRKDVAPSRAISTDGFATRTLLRLESFGSPREAHPPLSYQLGSFCFFFGGGFEVESR